MGLQGLIRLVCAGLVFGSLGFRVTGLGSWFGVGFERFGVVRPRVLGENSFAPAGPPGLRHYAPCVPHVDLSEQDLTYDSNRRQT